MGGFIGKGPTFVAFWLDQQLRERVGRPYRGILTAGLVISIIATVKALTKAFSTTNIVGLAATVVFQAALLINQLAQMYEYHQDRVEPRDAPKAAAAPGDEGAD